MRPKPDEHSKNISGVGRVLGAQHACHHERFAPGRKTAAVAADFVNPYFWGARRCPGRHPYLPRLKLIASTGSRNASIDMAAAKELGITVTATGYRSSPTIELTWALILASLRGIVHENNSIRNGGWQKSVGQDLSGKILGVVGLGNIGGQVARIGLAFGMEIIAWSQNMTPEIAEAAGARLVSKDELFRQADIVTIHLILSARTKGLVGAAELRLMKPTSRLINTSRGPIVDEASLIKALRSHAIAGAAIDVFDQEPLPSEHPFRSMDNMLATPHIGYVTEGLYRTFYGDTVANITAWLNNPHG